MRLFRSRIFLRGNVMYRRSKKLNCAERKSPRGARDCSGNPFGFSQKIGAESPVFLAPDPEGPKAPKKCAKGDRKKVNALDILAF
jgi:hypothetical protein